VNLDSENESLDHQWNVKGDEALQNVTVTWGGLDVGRISCSSKLQNHTYTVTIERGMNYCIMAALAIVFDDLRVDGMC